MHFSATGTVYYRPSDGLWVVRVSWKSRQQYLCSSTSETVARARLAAWLDHPTEPQRSQRQPAPPPPPPPPVSSNCKNRVHWACAGTAGKRGSKHACSCTCH